MTETSTTRRTSGAALRAGFDQEAPELTSPAKAGAIDLAPNVPGGDSAAMTIVAVGQGGTSEVLGTVPTASDAHRVAADDLGNTHVCDPAKGRFLVFADRFPTDTP